LGTAAEVAKSQILSNFMKYPGSLGDTSDDDWKPLRRDPRFQALLDQIKKKSSESK
jgi:hypothetical protein